MNDELSIAEILAARQTRPLEPLVARPDVLPIDKLDPPMVERLVAEVAIRVDGIVRIHGRSGQAQKGLDLWGGPPEHRSVYQVRRIPKLTPAKLRKAVEDYAGPPNIGDPQESWTTRRFDARRYVLATGCVVADEKVDLELDELQHAYAGDLEIELWDNRHISMLLTERGPIVAGIFGPQIAEVYCGYRPPADSPIPSGQALLSDPLVYLGLSGERDRAATLASTDPAEAAGVYQNLAARLQDAGYTAAGRALHWERRELLIKAHQNNAAVDATVEALLDCNESGDYARHHVSPLSPLARLLGTSAYTADPPPDGEQVEPVRAAAARVATAITVWAEDGYEVAPVARDLQTVTAAGHARRAELALAVAEQVVTDDDPIDDTTLLREVVADVIPGLPTSLLRVRLECCLADLEARLSRDPAAAFQNIVSRARLRAFLGEGHVALALRRAGYALAITNRAQDAIGLYQESVYPASEARLGGDARDSLRAVRFLSDSLDDQIMSGNAAGASGNRARLFPAGDEAGMSTLEYLADDHRIAALADALFEARTWLRIERVSGGIMEVAIAHRHHGQVLLRAGKFSAAVTPLVRAAQRDLAVKAAANAEQWCDVQRFLRDGPPWTWKAASAATAAQADLVADSAVPDVAAALARILQTPEWDIAKESLNGLAGLADRLPIDMADQVLSVLSSFFMRARDRPSMGDQEGLATLAALARHPKAEVSTPAVGLLVTALALRLDPAVGYLGQLPPTHVAHIERLAEEGSEQAVTVLALWGKASPAVIRGAREGAQRILDHQLGPRQVYSPGSSAPRDACALACALTAGVPLNESTAGRSPADPPLVDLLEVVTAHLMAWAEDRFDIADSRVPALEALRILRDQIKPEHTRHELHRRLLAIADQPNQHPSDLFDQASTDPLSRMRFDLGSEHLSAEALLTAANFATASDEAAAVADRLTASLAMGNTDVADAKLRALTLYELERLHPLPLDSFARHPAPAIRAAAVRLWGRRSPRSPQIVELLARDPERLVRCAVAHALIGLTTEDRTDFTDLLGHLAQDDPSHLVRRVLMVPPT